MPGERLSWSFPYPAGLEPKPKKRKGLGWGEGLWGGVFRDVAFLNTPSYTHTHTHTHTHTEFLGSSAPSVMGATFPGPQRRHGTHSGAVALNGARARAGRG